MKKEITKKFIYAKFGKENTVRLGIRNLGIFENYAIAKYYNTGVYGWNSDIFVFEGFCVSCGNIPFGKEYKFITNLFDNTNIENKKDFDNIIQEITNYLNK